MEPPTLEDVAKAVKMLKNGKGRTSGRTFRARGRTTFCTKSFYGFGVKNTYLPIGWMASLPRFTRKANESIVQTIKIMIEHGFPAKLVRLIRATLDRAKSYVRIADETSGAFVTLDRMKQGDVLSNLLFNKALEGSARSSGVQRNGTLITNSHMLLGFADDIDIIGIDRCAVKEVFVPFKRETARIGLTI